MNYKDFLLYIQTNIAKYFGKETKISIETVLKNNNVWLDGLVILEKGKSATPNIYMNDFYEKYLNEVSLNEIIDEILEVYRANSFDIRWDFSFINDYEKVKDRIVYKLINKSENEELLSDVPYEEVLDLAKCYCVFIRDNHQRNGLMLIHEKNLEIWGVSKTDIKCMAEENTPVIFKPRFCAMERMVNELLSMSVLPEGEGCGGSGMYVLTNCEKFYGASCILYPNLLADIAKKLKGNLYILPSSVHEVIILKKDNISKWELMDMVKSVNDEEVSQEEILSYMVYEYDRKDDILHI